MTQNELLNIDHQPKTNKKQLCTVFPQKVEMKIFILQMCFMMNNYAKLKSWKIITNIVSEIEYGLQNHAFQCQHVTSMMQQYYKEGKVVLVHMCCFTKKLNVLIDVWRKYWNIFVTWILES